MLSRYTARVVDSILAAETGRPPFPPASDRAAWTGVVRRHQCAPSGLLVDEAHDLAGEVVPALPATLYLDCKRTGERRPYEAPCARRRLMLSRFALAECVEATGEFLDPLLDVAWAICEESSWSWPAHQFDLADVHRPVIDLNAAATALELAEVDALLGDALDPALGRRIRAEVDRRCIAPFLERHDHWWLGAADGREVNNWTAVCCAGVLGAALYLETDRARLAEAVARAMPALDEYLATFDIDGGSTEGPGYWAYGFGHYVVLAHLLEQRTGGRIGLFDEPLVREIAAFPLRTVLSPGRWASFSDANEGVAFEPALPAYLSNRLGIPELMALAHTNAHANLPGSPLWALRRLHWFDLGSSAGTVVPAQRDWFRGMHWLIARADPADPGGLVLAANGGHNAEMHNQNDVGAIIVHVAGESLVVDPGPGRYTRDYFGPRRYDHPAASSIGHSVPVPNGRRQSPGGAHAATVLSREATGEEDRLVLDMRAAYPDSADLISLTRSVALRRSEAGGLVELTDTAEFHGAEGKLESVLTTFAEVTVHGAEAILRGERASVSATCLDPGVRVRVRTLKDVDLASGRRDLRRVVFAAPPGKTATLSLVIAPL